LRVLARDGHTCAFSDEEARGFQADAGGAACNQRAFVE
jgi:hypothetical protein